MTNDEVDEVERFKYFGFILEKIGGFEKDIKLASVNLCDKIISI